MPASTNTNTFTVTDVTPVTLTAAVDCDYCEIGENPAADGTVMYPFIVFEPDAVSASAGIRQFIGQTYRFQKARGCAYKIGETIGSVQLATAGSTTFKRRGA